MSNQAVTNVRAVLSMEREDSRDRALTAIARVEAILADLCERIRSENPITVGGHAIVAMADALLYAQRYVDATQALRMLSTVDGDEQ